MSDIITPSGLPNELLTIVNDNTLIEVYNPDTGQNEKMKVSVIVDYITEVPVITEWSDLTTYSTQGELVLLEGLTFAATGEALNQNKNPLDPNNGLFWYMPDDESDLLRDANRGTIRRGAMHTIHDRSSGNYATSIKVGKKKINGTQQNFFVLHLDGSVVTGNSELENLLDVGGGNEYIYLDEFAPLNLGTRTLVDMGERLATPQSSGGENDNLSEVLDDRFQGHWHEARQRGDSSPAGTANDLYSPLSENAGYVQTNTIGATANPIEDTEGGYATPRVGLTTRPKEFTEGISYIIIMQAA